VPSARTVLGDVPSADLGVCGAHDYLFFRSAQLAGQELVRHGRPGRPACSPACGGQLTADVASGGRVVRPELLADQLSLIMEGTYASGQALLANGPVRHTRTVTESLLDVS
jgi:hypothetical protein